MTWLAWRQFRTQAAVVAAMLVVVAIVAATTGPHLSQVQSAFLIACKRANDCSSVTDPVSNTYHAIQVAFSTLILLLPLLLGLFWGAPLIARELETGTYRLVWTQSVTRRRWLSVKLGVVGLASMSAAGLLSLAVTWFSTAPDAAQQNRFGVAMFGLRGVAPIGYAGFAFALGVATGVVMRRVLPAMATTIVGYIAARIAVTFWVRPHFMSPKHLTFSLLNSNGGLGFSLNAGSNVLTVEANPPLIPNVWEVSNQIVNNAGQSPSQNYLEKACPNLSGLSGSPAGAVGQSHAVPGGGGAFQACATKLAASYHELTAYQPASRYWAFQGLEAALFLVLAVTLGAFTLWWVRHKVV